MTRHAEMERPEWANTWDECTECLMADQERMTPALTSAQLLHLANRDNSKPKHHRRPYSRLRERNVFDPTYRPRHMNHRAEGAAS